MERRLLRQMLLLGRGGEACLASSLVGGVAMHELQPWAERFPAGHWMRYRAVLERLERRGFSFALGGGLAYAIYAERWRNTRDLDLFILPRDRAAMIAEVQQAGFDDYYSQLPYDRGWIYRGFYEGVILDLIWEMANHHAEVDEQWIARGREVNLGEFSMRILPVEELIWAKLYIVQRDRCDWPDLLSILYTEGARLDWSHLLFRLGDDRPLLTGLVSVFSWLCPDRAGQFPAWIWSRLNLKPPELGICCLEDRRRVAWIDSRDWFFPESLKR